MVHLKGESNNEKTPINVKRPNTAIEANSAINKKNFSGLLN